jgi:hypothetical protein
MEHALALADALAPGHTVSVLAPQTPTPLLELLHVRHFVTRVSQLDRGGARVWIHRPEHDGQAGH